MQSKTRQELIVELFPGTPSYRLKQIETASFDASVSGWQDVSTLPKAMRETLQERVPFLSVELVDMRSGAAGDTFKALLSVEGDSKIETVLMKNSRGYWTVCVSTQVGCAMRCAFCATGALGLTRNLTSDEIVDEFRFWQRFLHERPDEEQRISNVVYMGMGEPLANYDAVKTSLQTLLKNTDIGQTHLAVSTVGFLPGLERLLEDPDWPHVRMAVSLHSADENVRRKLMPSSVDDFLPKLADWAKRYLAKFGNRRHHLTFEYIMLSGVNDFGRDAKTLADYVNSIGDVRVNLIPCNPIGREFSKSGEEKLRDFQAILEENGVTVTVRESKGADIAAACGQLANKRQE